MRAGGLGLPTPWPSHPDRLRGKERLLVRDGSGQRLSSEEIPLALCSILHGCQAAQQEQRLLIQKIRICVYRLMARSFITLHPLASFFFLYLFPCVPGKKNLLCKSHSCLPFIISPFPLHLLSSQLNQLIFCRSRMLLYNQHWGEGGQYHKLKFSSPLILDCQH